MAHVSRDLKEYVTPPYVQHKIMQISDCDYEQGMNVDGICIKTLKSPLCPHTSIITSIILWTLGSVSTNSLEPSSDKKVQGSSRVSLYEC